MIGNPPYAPLISNKNSNLNKHLKTFILDSKNEDEDADADADVDADVDADIEDKGKDNIKQKLNINSIIKKYYSLDKFFAYDYKIPFSDLNQIMRYVIGKEGYHFKNITSLSGVVSIMYINEFQDDPFKKVIEIYYDTKFWDEIKNDSIGNALKLLYYHINFMIQKYYYVKYTYGDKKQKQKQKQNKNKNTNQNTNQITNQIQIQKDNNDEFPPLKKF